MFFNGAQNGILYLNFSTFDYGIGIFGSLKTTAGATKAETQNVYDGVLKVNKNFGISYTYMKGLGD